MKILLAEDDTNLGRLLCVLLKNANIAVDWVTDGEAAYKKVYTESYDVVILDWMMPKLDGLELCRRLRQEAYSGKIMLLTAKDKLNDKVTGLNTGADDYIVKPFDMEELIARLNALVRRQGIYVADNLEYGEYILESNTYCLVFKDGRVELRPREYRLLELLLRNRGCILSRDILQEHVWGIDNDVSENNLDVHIRMLRKKITELGGEDFIKTVRGVGYCVE
ncbi:MAG: response regulator transcription factor [Acidaminococcaceae bacterium]|nr:response regulator transcription factor [Acidaminococcaceae bacterium]